MKPRVTCVATANCPVRDWTTHQLFREDEAGVKTIFGYFEHHSGDDCELCAWELRARGPGETLVSDPGDARVKDVETAFKVVAEFSENCPHSEEEGDAIPILSCDKCMAKLIANAISDRRMDADQEKALRTAQERLDQCGVVIAEQKEVIGEALAHIEKIISRRYTQYTGDDAVEYLKEHGKLVLDDNGKEREIIRLWHRLRAAVKEVQP